MQILVVHNTLVQSSIFDDEQQAQSQDHDNNLVMHNEKTQSQDYGNCSCLELWPHTE